MKTSKEIISKIKRGMRRNSKVVVECQGVWFAVRHLYFKDGAALVGTDEGMILKADNLTDALLAHKF